MASKGKKSNIEASFEYHMEHDPEDSILILKTILKYECGIMYVNTDIVSQDLDKHYII